MDVNIISGVAFCLLGVLNWYLSRKFQDASVLNRVQYALTGNWIFLLGLYSLCSSPEFAAGKDVLFWIATGGIASAVVSFGLSLLALAKQSRKLREERQESDATVKGSEETREPHVSGGSIRTAYRDPAQEVLRAGRNR